MGDERKTLNQEKYKLKNRSLYKALKLFFFFISTSSAKGVNLG